MSTVVLLSSSPPTAFAPSLTPHDCSLYSLPSSPALEKSPTTGSLRFRPAGKKRDGFSPDIRPQRTALSTKIGAENVAFPSPSRGKFRPVSSNPTPSLCSPRTRRFKEPHDNFSSLQPNIPSKHFLAPDHTTTNKTVLTEVEAANDDGEPTYNPTESPTRIERAIHRKLDWTPSKNRDATELGLEPSTVGFPTSLMQSFAFEVDAADSRPELDGAVEPTRRSRIDLVHIAETHTRLTANHLGHSTSKPSLEFASKKSKSPTRKTVTITSRATTLYEEEYLNLPPKAPLLEYLSATQPRGTDTAHDPKSEQSTKAKRKPKITAKPNRASKKSIPKSRLVSPRSVMKSLAEQDMIFGSASQLAREDSPTLLRDTIEAFKRSEMFLSSDPISPQRTQPDSVDAVSPRATRGTSRFVKRRNLWSAAGRDEDNALLHVDTIDLSDSPAVRLALAGKDALTHPSEPTTTVRLSAQTPLAHKAKKSTNVMATTIPAASTGTVSPAKIQARSLHTAAAKRSPPRVGDACLVGEGEDVQATSSPSRKKAPRKPNKDFVKPSYAGFTDFALRKQLSAYGFKPVKKREKMIELLDRCWEDKHGSSETREDPATAAEEESEAGSRAHGEFLSNVHGVAARPQPKVKKPRAKRKSEGDDTITAKEPKKRKKAEPKAKVSKPKTPKKKAATKATKPSTGRKVNTTALSEEFVLDVSSDIEDSAIEDSRTDPVEQSSKTDQQSDPEPKSKSKSKSKPKTQKPSKQEEEIPTMPTPLPILELSSSPLPGLHDKPPGKLAESGLTDASLFTTATTGIDPSIDSESRPLPDLQSQIRAAIMSSQDPATSKRGGSMPTPTWREKILMYDPIVLEDLTAWLNTTGLGAIHEDREVSALEVREWCERNGVCCYGIGGGWRGNHGINNTNNSGNKDGSKRTV
ncbi:hypothetical protein PV10_03491 [Exophiala mesophila]|uniref:Structure-specific endonuclease subunit SLX4 n=1 Tax=Exophiala mesophila TaxID=212818 RepID=A0A0D1X296_EXOME|nr:uncharacterized protein PV10_03491 [Exophiala mesophila]KIV95890.1 hypothetical protein PV10_03491 [Exophiala mesophila]